MARQFFPQASGLCRSERLIPRSWSVRVELLQHHTPHLRRRVPGRDQPSPLGRAVPLGALGRAILMAPACLPRTMHKAVAGACARKLVIDALRPPWLQRQWGLLGSEPWPARVIATAFWAFGIRGCGLQRPHVCHRRAACPADGGDAPLLLQPRFQGGFWRTRHPVSWEQERARGHATTRSASTGSVHRSRPSGAWLHAAARRRASPRASSPGCCPGRGRSSRAPSRLAAQRFRVRSPVGMRVSTASAIASARPPAATLSRIRARVKRRAAGCPRRSICSRGGRSAAVRATWYFFAGLAGPAPSVSCAPD
jgi:hypothetical protein